MKSEPKFSPFVVASFLLGALVSILPPAAAQTQSARGSQVKFVTGGVGEESAARMAALGAEYNLKLLFAARDGHYLADVAVTISAVGGGKLLETVSEGPFLFAQFAPGKYQVSATYAGVTQSRNTTVAATGRRELIFRWEEPAEPRAESQ